LSFVFGDSPRKAICSIDSSKAYNLVKGTIGITYDGAGNTVFSVSLTNTTGNLVAAGNGLHIHQVGVDSSSASCGDALKHYNPMINYGEISSRATKIPANGAVNINVNWVKFEGEYSILGRAMVVHDDTTKRLACCTIALTEEDSTGTMSMGYSGSVLLARLPGVTLNFTSATSASLTTTSTLTDASNTFYVQKYGDCASTSTVVFNHTTSFSNTPGTTTLTLSGVTNLGVFAGRTLVRQSAGATKECSIVLQTAYQTNINDTYVADTTSATGTTETKKNNFNQLFASILMSLFSILF